MCGIVGYIGNKKANDILINGLLKLEYRGYDSCGISLIEKNEIKTLKTKDRVKSLSENLELVNSTATIGIAHTRWATHGKPNVINSHPHLDNEKNFSVVHNGIIENYQELKEFLKNNGYSFLSETDTEVIPNLINFFFKESNNFLKAVHSTCNKLKGSFALEVLSKIHPDRIIVIRKDSPMVIGTAENENYICSDIPGILQYTRNFYMLNNYEYAEVYTNKICFYDKNLSPIEKELKNIEWDANAAEKDGFEHYMLKEIYEQPKSIRETIGSKIKLNTLTDFNELDFSHKYLSKINKIFIVACGTAMHTGLVGKVLIETLCNIPVEVDIASEFRYRNPIISENTLAIFVSQSGETADTIAALKLAKSHGASTLAICNVLR